MHFVGKKTRTRVFENVARFIYMKGCFVDQVSADRRTHKTISLKHARTSEFIMIHGNINPHPIKRFAFIFRQL